MPKIGVIYNDIKPIACQVATELKEKLTAEGYQVHLATGYAGILGYSRPDRPVCYSAIEKNCSFRL